MDLNISKELVFVIACEKYLCVFFFFTFNFKNKENENFSLNKLLIFKSDYFTKSDYSKTIVFITSFISTNSLCFHLPSPKTMPGLTAPSDYSKEPPRHPSLQINSKVINHLSLSSKRSF